MSEEELKQLLKVKGIKPDVIQTMLLYRIYKKLDSIERIKKTELSKGIIRPLTTDVSENGTIIYADSQWIKAYIFNDGPDSVWRGVNVKGGAGMPHLLEIKKGESSTIDLASSEEKIHYIWLICKKGESASVRIDTKR